MSTPSAATYRLQWDDCRRRRERVRTHRQYHRADAVRGSRAVYLSQLHAVAVTLHGRRRRRYTGPLALRWSLAVSH